MKPVEAFIEHRGFVESLARRLVADENEADDIVQETWRVAIERPPGRDDNLRGWLGTVVRSQTISRIRSRVSRKRYEAHRESDPSPMGPEELLEREQVRQHLSRALSELSAEQREVIELRFHEGLAPREIAARLGAPVETVRTRTKRALARLRQILDRAYSGDRPAWALALARWGRPGLGAGQAPAQPAVRPSLPEGPTRAAGPAGVSPVTLPLLAVASLSVLAVWVLRTPEDEAPTPSSPTVAAVPSAGRTSPAAGLAGGRIRMAADRSAAPLPSTPESERGDLQLQLVWEDTGEPATGVSVRLHAGPGLSGAHEPYPEQDVGTAVASDPSGRVRFSELAPGTWTLSTNRALSRDVVVQGESPTSLEWVLPRGRTYRGHTRFLNGTPCPGAEILASLPGDPGSLRSVGRSDATGAFETPPLSAECWIGARLGDRQVTLSHLRRFEGGRPLELFLPLPTDAGLQVLVRDPQGRPIAGAEVEVGTRVAGLTRFGLRGTLIRNSGPFVGRTGSDGKLHLRELEPGPVRLRVRAAGWATATIERPRDAPGEDPIEVRLQAEACVAGTLVDQRGAPYAGARVTGIPRDGSGRVTTTADAAGRYRLLGLPAGSVDLHVAADAAPERAGSARGTLELEAGVRREWSPELSDAGVLRARVWLPDGSPAAGRWVDLRPEAPEPAPIETLFPSGDRRAAFPLRPVGDDGLVCFAVDPDVTYCLRLWPTGRATGLPLGWRGGVRAGSPDVVLRAADPGRGVVHAGALVDDVGAPVGDAEILLWAPFLEQAVRVAVDPGSGTFTTPPLPRARYRVGVWPDDRPPTFDLWTADLRNGPHTLLEPAVVPAPARLRVRILDPSGAPNTAPCRVLLTGDDLVAVARDARSPSAFVISRSGLDLPPLRAGSYDLRLSGVGTAPVVQRLELLPGDELERTIRLEWDLDAAHFQVVLPETTASPAKLEWTVFDPIGTARRTQQIRVPPNVTGVPLSIGGLAPGSYVAEFTLRMAGEPQLAGKALFELPSSSHTTDRIQVELERGRQPRDP